jgi:uncharacterized coiled-coil protein SlyX
MEERITELEIQLAQHQETVRALDEVVVDQGRRIEALETEVRRLAGSARATARDEGDAAAY